MNREAYLDHNAFSPLRPSALAAMEPWLTSRGANPASPHRRGTRARAALDEARERIASALGATEHEVVFTSGATESNHLALLGCAQDPATGRRLPVVTTAIEHPSVLEPARFLAERGSALSIVPPRRDGAIHAEDVLGAIEEAGPGAIASVQAVNHETGSLLPIAEIGRRRPADVWFHVDAAQSVGKAPLDLEKHRIDLLSLSGHKIGGPPGIGALLVRRGVPLRPLLLGGKQEGGLRSGTVPVALAVGFAVALEEALAESGELHRRHKVFRERILAAARAAHPSAEPFGGPTVHPSTLMIAFPGVDREALLVNLDLRGVRVSTGAACASGSLETSPVLRAMGVDEERARTAIRISLGWCTNEDDIDQLLEVLPEALARARRTETFFGSQHHPN